ncbi:UNVERIFIED_CONTAM: hypothetical protein Cloal_2062 [Acetivibrio alkalicellulosi]
MKSNELVEYLSKISEYIEYSFFKNSSEIMESLMKKGFNEVFELEKLEEVSKGIYVCQCVWNVDDKKLKKQVNIDITNEMIFITEVI